MVNRDTDQPYQKLNPAFRLQYVPLLLQTEVLSTKKLSPVELHSNRQVCRECYQAQSPSTDSKSVSLILVSDSP
jgi:hypothetical protein